MKRVCRLWYLCCKGSQPAIMFHESCWGNSHRMYHGSWMLLKWDDLSTPSQWICIRESFWRCTSWYPSCFFPEGIAVSLGFPKKKDVGSFAQNLDSTPPKLALNCSIPGLIHTEFGTQGSLDSPETGRYELMFWIFIRFHRRDDDVYSSTLWMFPCFFPGRIPT